MTRLGFIIAAFLVWGGLCFLFGVIYVLRDTETLTPEERRVLAALRLHENGRVE